MADDIPTIETPRKSWAKFAAFAIVAAIVIAGAAFGILWLRRSKGTEVNVGKTTAVEVPQQPAQEKALVITLPEDTSGYPALGGVPRPAQQPLVEHLLSDEEKRAYGFPVYLAVRLRIVMDADGKEQAVLETVSGSEDTDGDGVADAQERTDGTDPNSADVTDAPSSTQDSYTTRQK